MDNQTVIEQIQQLDTKIIAALIAALVSVFIAFLNYILQRKSLNLQEKSFVSQMNDKRRENIKRQLNEFYNPFNYYLTKSAEYFKTFRNGLPKEFRTLEYLIDKDREFEDSNGKFIKVKLDSKRLKILEQIMLIEDKLKELIIEKGGLVEDEVLAKKYIPDPRYTDINLNYDSERPDEIPKDIGLLALFSIHIDFLKMAYNGELDKEHFNVLKNYVYPRELNKRIDDNMNKLNDALKV